MLSTFYSEQSKKEHSEEKNRYIIAGGVSLLLHILLLLVIDVEPTTARVREIEVSLLQDADRENQIVSPPEVEETEEPKEAKLFSSKNVKTDVQTLKRGDGGSVSKDTPDKQQAPPAKQVTETKTKEDSAQKIKSPAEQKAKEPAKKVEPQKKENTKKAIDPQDAKLTLDGAAMSKFVSPIKVPQRQEKKSQETPEQMEQERNRSIEDYKPFRKGSIPFLLGRRSGNLDYLPDIPDGDITLLNTKAALHAVFVRRVAMQVFGALRKYNWSQVSYREARSVRDFVMVEAVMSTSGKLLSAKMLDSSGSRNFDSSLLQAAEDGTWDQNPPAAAVASDGNIHFLFKAKTWASPGAEGIGEHRWILLGTGLR